MFRLGFPDIDLRIIDTYGYSSQSSESIESSRMLVKMQLPRPQLENLIQFTFRVGPREVLFHQAWQVTGKQVVMGNPDQMRNVSGKTISHYQQSPKGVPDSRKPESY